MECRDARELLAAHVDGELRGREALEVARHLETCADCAAAQSALTAMRRAVQSGATRYRAPEALAARVQAALPAQPRQQPNAVVRSWQRLALASAFASALAIAFAIGVLVTRPIPSDLVADDIVATHVRSLVSGRPVDVASSDRHTVKPWFAGKLDYSPPVHDLSEQGFPLVGGRVDYIDHRPVAALVYRRHQHTINLYVRPAAPGAPNSGPTSESRQGFQLLRWVRDGMAYFAISDTEPAELAQFRAALVALD
jgi:anti-sigma factor RsiW